MIDTNGRTPIIAIASGKGGAGKTSFTLNLCYQLAQKGKRVLVFDADIGLANIDVQLGINTMKDLSDVVQGFASLEDIIAKSEKGFYIIPGRSGFEKQPFMTTLERRDILKKLRDLAGAYDYVFLDVAAGIDQEVLNFTKFADKSFLVVTPDPSSITDAYAVIKLLKTKHDKENCEVIINQAGSLPEGKNTFAKLRMAAEKFLKINLPLVGIIPYDRQYSTAVKMQQLTSIAFPNSDSAVAIEKIALKLIEEYGHREVDDRRIG
ncbi:MAG: flagellar biosynthesis protein FlhG [Alphaproteobacteria bacterium]|jgi:flagellar biosynthesis protein FlhG